MGAVEHIDLAEWAELVVVAPGDYNHLGKLYAASADDSVTTFLTAVVSAPCTSHAGDERYMCAPVNQRNVEGCAASVTGSIDPSAAGWPAAGKGRGGFASAERSVEALRTGARSRPAGRQAHAVAAGRRPSAAHSSSSPPPVTHEGIDPVRFIGNRSSGKMGYALAAQAARRGARVVLVESGPSRSPCRPAWPRSAGWRPPRPMLAALRDELPKADALLMAAAVADYRPAGRRATRSSARTRRYSSRSNDARHLEVAGAAQAGRLFVGFALETGARRPKRAPSCAAKGLDLVVANRVGPATGPDTDTNQVWIYDADGLVLETPLLDKSRIAEAVLGVVEARLATRKAGSRG